MKDSIRGLEEFVEHYHSASSSSTTSSSTSPIKTRMLPVYAVLAEQRKLQRIQNQSFLKMDFGPSEDSSSCCNNDSSTTSDGENESCSAMSSGPVFSYFDPKTLMEQQKQQILAQMYHCMTYKYQQKAYQMALQDEKEAADIYNRYNHLDFDFDVDDGEDEDDFGEYLLSSPPPPPPPPYEVGRYDSSSYFGDVENGDTGTTKDFLDAAGGDSHDSQDSQRRRRRGPRRNGSEDDYDEEGSAADPAPATRMSSLDQLIDMIGCGSSGECGCGWWMRILPPISKW